MSLKENISSLKLPIVAGHVIECFDNTLYGFFAVMLAPIFFSNETGISSILMAYGGFAAGFFARPLGALFWGSMGDKYGRKKPMLWSLMFVGVPTIIIGLIPPYQVWGGWASLVLILCRLAQGFFYGGEWAGVNLYNIEQEQKSDLGARSGLLLASGTLGGAFATAVGALVTMEGMPPWAWRIPFFFGGISAFIIYLFRRRLKETAEFEGIRKQDGLTQSPIKILLANYKKELILAMLIAGLTAMPLYFSTVFANKILGELGYSPAQSMVVNLGAMIMTCVTVVVSGFIADKLGFVRHILVSLLLTTVLAFPAFWFISGAIVSPFHIVGFVLILTTFGLMINGCAAPYAASFFPTNCRYSGVALSFMVGGTVIGGTTPLVGTLLVDWFHTNIAPAFWLAFVAGTTAMLVWNHSQSHSQQPR